MFAALGIIAARWAILNAWAFGAAKHFGIHIMAVQSTENNHCANCTYNWQGIRPEFACIAGYFLQTHAGYCITDLNSGGKCEEARGTGKHTQDTWWYHAKPSPKDYWTAS